MIGWKLALGDDRLQLQSLDAEDEREGTRYNTHRGAVAGCVSHRAWAWIVRVARYEEDVRGCSEASLYSAVYVHETL